MKNYKFEISYDGTAYYGWERKKGLDTIQGKLEAVLTRMTDRDVEVIGAGRTDAGVHAKKMTANAHLETDLQPDAIRDYMNRYLPADICINDVKEASERFHARYNACGKSYTYTCYCGPLKPVFDRRYVVVLDYNPDIDLMRQAAEYLIGTYDFASFCSNARMKKSTVRTVDKIDIHSRKGYLYFDFHGDGFLQNMVRIIVGTLLEVGRGRISPSDMQSILAAKDRSLAGPTAEYQGLCLMQVDY